MNSRYAINSSKDYGKISDFAEKVYEGIGNVRHHSVVGWGADDNLFTIRVWISECGCDDILSFPIEWLDVVPEEGRTLDQTIASMITHDLSKPANERVVVYV